MVAWMTTPWSHRSDGKNRSMGASLRSEGELRSSPGLAGETISNSLVDETLGSATSMNISGVGGATSSRTNFVASVGEIPPGASASASRVDQSSAEFQGKGLSLIEDLYQENCRVREQLDAKRNDLVAALQAQQQADQTLRQIIAERQSLFSEVRCLQAKTEQLQTTVSEEQREREAADRRSQDWERRFRDAEELRTRLEERFTEAEERARKSDQLHLDNLSLFQDAEKKAVDVELKIRAAEQSQHLKAEAQIHELQVEVLELKAEYASEKQTCNRRQREIKAALGELQALSQGQQTLRSELRRAARPAPVLPYFASTLRGVSGLADVDFTPHICQDAVERMQARVSMARSLQRASPQACSCANSMSSDKVRDHIAYLEDARAQYLTS